MSSISIIIPIYNEVEHITNLLNHLKNKASKNNNLEIIVVDGGSTDQSKQAVLDAQKDINNNIISVQYLLANKGRAKQMNAGAQVATADILYFLHADSYPPKNFDTLIVYEDNDLISKLYAIKQFYVIQQSWIITSARCYEKHGVFKLQMHYWTIHLKKWLGATPKQLNDYYFKHVSVKKS